MKNTIQFTVGTDALAVPTSFSAFMLSVEKRIWSLFSMAHKINASSACTPVSNVHVFPTRQARQSHFVQFYEEDSALIQGVVAFLSEGFEKGEAGIVIATPAHRASLTADLQVAGQDVAALVRTRQLTFLDAQETLSHFMVHGRPQTDAFRATIGGLLEEVQALYPAVRAFGEMVNLLWAQGNVAGTIRLEKEWNDLGQKYPFHLFCGYALNQFSSSTHTESFQHICAEHSMSFPSHGVTLLTDEQSKLKVIAGLQQQAKALEAEIAERKQTESALARANEELRSFTYAVSHDLREPLRTIRMHLQRVEKLSEQLEKDSEVGSSLGFVLSAAKRMDALLTSTLSFARLDVDRQPLVLVDCNTILEEALANLADSIRSTGAQVTCAQLPTIHAFPLQLVQVFQNLISNAIKFRNGAAPVVRVSAERGGNAKEWIFSVADNGMGIHLEYQQQIFKMFQRLHTSHKYPGSGLGLSICKKIVETLKGRIWVESDPGQGATFRFSIPDLATL